MRIIKADINKEKGKLDRFFEACVGAGRAGEVMRYVPMRQLNRMQEECPFSYIRFHGLFHEEMNVVQYDEDGNLVFCFQYVDLLFDSLLEHNIRPVVEIGLMPDILGKEKAYVFWWKMNISMPADMEKWSLLVEKLIRHLTNRYGREEIRKWYFEIWNEPNHPAFFTEYKNLDSYITLYHAAVAAIKKIDSAYQVGGPATAGMGWLPEFIWHCREYQVPLDFISSHVYGVRGDFDSDGRKQLWMLPADQTVEEIRKGGRICAEYGLPLLVTEWSSSYSPTDPVHDSYVNAPYMLYVMKRVAGYADMLSYWAYTDIFEELGVPTKPFHGGFGLFNVQSIPKPSYYVYSFLHKLGNMEIECEDSDAYVCKSDCGIQILFWNFVQPNQDVDNRKYYVRDLPAKEIEDIRIEIHGFKPNQKIYMEIETIGYRKGDAYNEYQREFKDGYYTRESEAGLMESSTPKKRVMFLRANNEGILEFLLPQNENQVDLVQIFL